MTNTIKRLATLLLLIAIAGGAAFSGYRYGILEDNTTNEFRQLEEIYRLLDRYHASDIEDGQLMEGALIGMVASLNDPYTAILTPSFGGAQRVPGGYIGLGVNVRFADNIVIVDDVVFNGPAYQAGVAKGDIIVSVDDIDIYGLPRAVIIPLLSGSEGDQINLKLSRMGYQDPLEVTVNIGFIADPLVSHQTILVNDEVLGYIKINGFEAGLEEHGTGALLRTALDALEEANITGLIIDVRGNPGGSVSALVSVVNRFLHGDDPYFFDHTIRTDEIKSYAPTRTEPRPYDIVTLIDGQSASAAEAFAAAMKEHGNYPLFGETTYGKGVFQRHHELRYTHAILSITEGLWYTPDFNNVNDVGVSPTHPVSPSAIWNSHAPIYQSDIGLDEVHPALPNIQTILTALGYTVRKDGYFDEAMRTTLLTFQADENIPMTGLLDATTLATLASLYYDARADDQFDAVLQAAIAYFNHD